MSARDAESGSSSYKGGSGRAGGLGNGGIGGGMGGGGNWGGGMGGGAGRNGGIGNRTGMMTGNMMYGGMAMGRPGGMAMNPGAWGMRPQAAVQQAPMGRPPGLLGNPTPASSIPDERILAVEDVLPPSPVPNVFNQNYLNSIVDFRNAMKNQYGWGNAVPGPGPMPANYGVDLHYGSGDWNTTSTPDPLANDLSRFGNPGARPTKIGSVSGGLGVPGYNASRNPSVNSNPSSSGRGWGGWNSGWN